MNYTRECCNIHLKKCTRCYYGMAQNNSIESPEALNNDTSQGQTWQKVALAKAKIITTKWACRGRPQRRNIRAGKGSQRVMLCYVLQQVVSETRICVGEHNVLWFCKRKGPRNQENTYPNKWVISARTNPICSPYPVASPSNTHTPISYYRVEVDKLL